MESDRIAYFEPRVMRHRKGTGDEEYAIHDVYFSEDGRVVRYTLDALTPREPTVEQLKATLARLLEENGAEITTGDLHYTYDREEVEDWLQCTEKPSIDYRGERAQQTSRRL